MKKINKTFQLLFIFFVSGLLLNWILSGKGMPSFSEFFFAKPDRFSAVISPYYYSVIMLLGINIMLSVSLALLNGLTGLFTMGHAGFMAIGAYSSAALSYYWLRDCSPLVQMGLGLVVGGGLAALTGYLIGFSVLRLNGDYLGMVTLGFGEIIRIVLLNVDAVGGARGMTDIPLFMNLGVVFVVAAIAILFIKRTRDGRHGRAMLAIKENEMAANMMGINPVEVKMRAFILSSFMAGVAGVCFAHSEGYLSTQTFSFAKSFEVIAMNVIGGLGSLSGAILGGTILTILPEALRYLQDLTGIDLRMVIYALTLVLIMILRPKGLMGQKEWKCLSSK